MQNYADKNERVFYGASLDDILNEVQNLSDGNWTDMSSEVMESSEQDSKIAEVQYNTLCKWADQHDIMGSKFIPTYPDRCCISTFTHNTKPAQLSKQKIQIVNAYINRKAKNASTTNFLTLKV